jgi:hypothetical protein
MGRPRLASVDRPVRHNVRLSPAISDEVYRLSTARHESQYAFLGSLIERVITLHLTRHGSTACYASPQSSTLSGMLSESPSSRACQSGR